MTICPCGSGKEFTACCERFLSGTAFPETPEQLMRSRYSAYTLSDIDYIERTMAAPANIDFNAEDSQKWAASVTWLKLEVLYSHFENDKGYVEFCAHFMLANKKDVIHEISEFHKKEGKWFYVDGVEPASVKDKNVIKISRNEICPCGSLKKYKKCCGIKS